MAMNRGRNTSPVFFPSSYDSDVDYIMHHVDPIDWEDQAIPDYIRRGDEYFSEEEDKMIKENNFVNIFKNVLSSFPVFGSMFSAFMSIPQTIMQNKAIKFANARNKWETYKSNAYNSPKAQMARMRAGGLNPYIQGSAGVRSYPYERTSYIPPAFDSVPPVHESIAGIMNAITNANLASARINNLESLTDLNQYKYEYLLPQLFQRNGYVNNILELQSAWETGNYEYERQLKQNMLNTSYMVSVAALGEQIMKLQPQIDGVKTVVDVNSGTINYVAEDGTLIDPSQLSFNQLPLFMQDAFVDIYSKQSNISLNAARQHLMSAQENQYNAMASLYNANRDKVQIDVDSYHRTGVWSTEDFTLRYAAGLVNDQTYWKNFGLNTINSIQDATIDVGSAWVNPRVLFKSQNAPLPSAIPNIPNVHPQPLNIPKGARPFTVNGQVYYYKK